MKQGYALIIIVLCMTLQGSMPLTYAEQSTGSKLNQFVRDMQLKYVERSYSSSYKECFTDKDLITFSKNIKTLQADIAQEPALDELKRSIKSLPLAQREQLIANAMKIKSPTWSDVGAVNSSGQTIAGQKAEQMVATYIVSYLKSTSGKTQKPTKMPWKLIWKDEFESHGKVLPDTRKWGYDLGGDGWGNEELEYYTDSIKNAFVENGMLNIQVIPEPYKTNSFTSARLVTRDLAFWSSGRIEVMAKLPYGQGIWPAIWLLPQNDVYGGYEKNGEIDIMEMVGHDIKTIYGSLHYDVNSRLHSAINSSDNQLRETDANYSKAFHLYAVEWDANWMRWYVDGHPYASLKMSKLFADPNYQPFKQPFYLVLNVAVGGSWPGSPNDLTRFPQKMVVDYVRVYQKE